MRLFGTKKNAAHIAPKKRKRADKTADNVEIPYSQAEEPPVYRPEPTRRRVEEPPAYRPEPTHRQVEEPPVYRAEKPRRQVEEPPVHRTPKPRRQIEEQAYTPEDDPYAWVDDLQPWEDGSSEEEEFEEKRPRRRSRLKKALLITGIVLFVLVGSAYAFMTLFPTPPDVQGYHPSSPSADSSDPIDHTVIAPGQARDPINRPSGIYTILVAGQDDEGGLTDTLMIAAVDTLNGAINIVNIPRDTMVDIPWEVRKINGVLPGFGIDRLMREMERILGFHPDNYVILDLVAFEALVNAIDGVYFDVPVRMFYVDTCQDPPLRIDLQPGYQHLDGAQALQLVRFRGYQDADIGRIHTQQAFLGAVAGELLQVRNITRIPTLIDIFVSYVDTDLDVRELAWFADQVRNIDSEDINFHTLPGDYDAWIGGISYVIIDPDEWLLMVNSYLYPFPERTPVTLENVRLWVRAPGGLSLVGDDISKTGPRQ